MILLTKTDDELLAELGLGNLMGDERRKALDKLHEHLNDVIIDALIKHLSQEQFERFKNAVAADDAKTQVALIAAEVPGLDRLIQLRVDEEFKLLKTAMNP